MMARFFSEKKIIKIDQSWGMSSGSFCTITRKGRMHGYNKSAWVTNQWHACREDFLESQRRNRMIAFCFGDQYNGRDIASFMRIIERKAKVSPRSEFGPTQLNKVIWINLSPWWTTSMMKRSFLTMMLRTAQNYTVKKDNFDEALFNGKKGNQHHNRYSRCTKLAVARFLRGYTRYRGDQTGWFSQFGEHHHDRYGRYRLPNEEAIKQLLVKPLE